MYPYQLKDINDNYTNNNYMDITGEQTIYLQKLDNTTSQISKKDDKKKIMTKT